MHTAKEVEAKIIEIRDEARGELSGNPAHIDTDNLKGMADEINELQQKIWEIESKEGEA